MGSNGSSVVTFVKELGTMSKKQIDVSFSCFSPGIDRENHHNIVKAAVRPRDHNLMDLQTTLTV